MEKRYYRGQALAIVMVVLVVASIIGIALFSRMSKDRKSVVNQQDSANAQEQADAILNLFLGVDIEVLEASLEEDAFIYPAGGYSDLKGFLDAKNIGLDTSPLSEYDLCDGKSASGIRMSVSFTDADDFIEIQPGGVRAFYLGSDASVTDPCLLNVRLMPVGNYAVFVEKIVYNDGSEDMVSYCIGSECADIDVVEYEDGLDSTTWQVGEDSGYYTKPSGYNLFNTNISEIRLLPISGVLMVANDSLSCINREFRYSKVTAEVNCYGSYRAKEMYIPGSGSLGYPTLFDYAVYDMGLFQP